MRLLFALIFLCGFLSCKKEKTKPVIKDSEYYFVRMNIATNKGEIDSFYYSNGDSIYAVSGGGYIHFNAAKGASVWCKGKGANLAGGTVVLTLQAFKNTDNGMIYSKSEMTGEDGKFVEIKTTLPN